MSCWKIKTVHHSVDLLHHRGVRQKIFLALLLKLTDKIVCNSEKSQELIRTFLVPEKKVSVIRNGIDVVSYKKDYSRALEFRKTHSLGENDFVIGTVANFRKVKNYPFLMKAF